MYGSSYFDDRISVPESLTMDLTKGEAIGTVLISAECGKAVLVKAGDPVFIGQKLSEGDNEEAVFASLSGTVTSVTVSDKATYIEIKNDGAGKTDPECAPFGKKLKDSTPEDIIGIAERAGIRECMTGEYLHRKLRGISSGTDSIVIDCIGKNPFLPIPGIIARERSASLINGIKILIVATGARKAYIIAGDGSDRMLDHLKELAGRAGFVRVLEQKNGRTEYPHAVTDKMIRKLTSDSAGRYAVFGPEACLDIYKAFSSGIPCVSKSLTVGGDCVKRASNITVPLGTRIKELLKISGLTKKPSRIIVGDPLTGRSMTGPDETVTIATEAVYILSDEVSFASTPGACIRCGKCADICANGVIPVYIVRQAAHDRPPLITYGAENCTECGMCSYVCPCGIDIVGKIRRVKERL